MCAASAFAVTSAVNVAAYRGSACTGERFWERADLQNDDCMDVSHYEAPNSLTIVDFEGEQALRVYSDDNCQEQIVEQLEDVCYQLTDGVGSFQVVFSS